MEYNTVMIDAQFQKQLEDLSQKHPEALASYFFLEKFKYYVLHDSTNNKPLLESLLQIWNYFYKDT